MEVTESRTPFSIKQTDTLLNKICLVSITNDVHTLFMTSKAINPNSGDGQICNVILFGVFDNHLEDYYWYFNVIIALLSVVRSVRFYKRPRP